MHLGCNPTTDANGILMDNLLDIILSVTANIFIGLTFFVGPHSCKGLIGYGSTICSKDVDHLRVITSKWFSKSPPPPPINCISTGITSSLTSSVVVLSPLTGRVRKVAIALITIVFCGFVLPMCLHWTQHENGWLHDMYDNSGATAVHLASGTVGILASAFLGHRLLIASEIDRCSVALESPSNTFMGYFLVIIGLIGNLLMSLDQVDVLDSILVVNSLMAIGGAFLLCIMLHSCAQSERFGYWDITRCLQSAVAALVALSFGIHYYLPSLSFVVGALTSTFFFIVATLIDFTPLEDNCNVAAIYFSGAMVGAILLPVFCKWKVLGDHATVLTRLSKCAWQVVYCLIIIGFCSVIFTALFVFLKATRLFRNKSEINNHNRAIHLKRKKNVGWCGRFFKTHSTFPFGERITEDTSSFILETRGSEQRRPWVARPNQRRVSFLIRD